TRFILDSAEKLRRLGGNTLVFDAKDDMGAITYHSPIPAKYCPNEHYTPNIEELPKMIEFLHHQGIHVVARVVVFKDEIMTRAKPEWCMNREKFWLNPGNPEVQEYVLTIIRELAESGLDEIQLDYVRYFADGKTTAGKEGLARTDVIAGFLKKVHDITAPKGVLLSMDMFGIVVWQRDVDVLVVGQDVIKIKPHVDIISPMLYPSHFSAGFAGVKNPADDPYRFVFNGMKRMKELVGDGVVIRPWLQSFPLRVTRGFGPKYIKTQIEAGNDAGGTGWLLWSPGNHYRDAYIAMQNLPKQKTETHEAGAGTKTKEPQLQPPAKNALPASPPIGATQQPVTGHPSGVNTPAENTKPSISTIKSTPAPPPSATPVPDPRTSIKS
ncbi:MAG TPA: putative glycoside hydrolase, partial [Desulfomonilia bacterium]|nr:putative glycoside hydrolase [Desulfomonilia bacterium]